MYADGWMDGWMDGRTDGRTDRRMDGCMNASSAMVRGACPTGGGARLQLDAVGLAESEHVLIVLVRIPLDLRASPVVLSGAPVRYCAP